MADLETPTSKIVFNLCSSSSNYNLKAHISSNFHHQIRQGRDGRP
ncbi:hypothetical protein ERO13_D10G107700v2 [Gossypium hirsutum]|uniref:Uncharacterized protein n=3 Tax=Gossypium TaxID=3633 RepID=A0A5J5PRZ4_GOSBA|nr:hypothetical protein ES319_D10G117100v1 [Gossypium barbadense]KAG4125629.1 hypothetical protein ERO13_D10G107700v2 [Gossypium hirsutum]TYG49820.1 hypothetical protein ES288_D10G125000v1 [Gossypium darwinii]TYH49314.1 hypothetical protein ES332_D10G127200v1 [Gossypium tomentosum]